MTWEYSKQSELSIKKFIYEKVPLFGLFYIIFPLLFSFRQFGAIGSRLTGAGWGGCTVSMVPTDKLNTFLKNVKKAYYQTDGQRLAVEDNSLFATKPGRGALVFVEA